MQRIVVVKIGGSVITDRNGYCTLDHDATHRFVGAFSRWLPRAPAPPVLVLGGGSFGHNVVVRHGIDLDGRHAERAAAFELTARLFELKAAVARELALAGVAAMPLQEAGLFARGDDGGVRLVGHHVLSACVTGGWLPLLTGGLVADQHGEFPVVSSDRLAVAMAEHFAIERYVVLTDRAGLCDTTAEGAPVVKALLPEQRGAAELLVQPSSKVDVNGGMAEKLAATFDLATMGVASVIADGRELDPARLAACFDEDPPGTLVRPGP